MLSKHLNNSLQVLDIKWNLTIWLSQNMGDVIGNLEVNLRSSIGVGQFGKMFKGTYIYKKRTTVTVTRVKKEDFYVDEDILLKKGQNHDNILKYYCTEETEKYQ